MWIIFVWKMKEIMPELYSCVSLSKKYHHNLSIYEHMMKAADSLRVKDLKYVWTMTLHDIGKIYRIKNLIANFNDDYDQFKGTPYRLEIIDDTLLIIKKLIIIWLLQI